MSRRADALWQRLITAVMDTRDGYRREVAAATGLPFGRARVLRRLSGGPLMLRELAESAGSDAPSTTVAINDLEERGLVARTPHPTNRRAKLVALTPAGRALVARMQAIAEPAPPALASAAKRELDALAELLDRLDAERTPG
jgi:DNA-binding MarR family transcriptional regulator